jgi:hypothetical protein
MDVLIFTSSISMKHISMNKSIALLSGAFIVPLAISAQVITTFAGNGTAGYSGDNGPATASQLREPGSTAMDTAGNLYIADMDNFVIRKVNTSGIITTIAGTGINGNSGNGGLATAANIAPSGLAIDRTGAIYFSDYYHYVVRKVSPTGIITALAGTGIAGTSGSGGPAMAAQLLGPTSLAIDPAGNIFIADAGLIRKVSPSGILTTIAGGGINAAVNYNGPASNARLNFSYNTGIALDSVGNIYVADYYNHVIRKISSSGVISTVAGDGIGAYSGDGGPASAAQLNRPCGLAINRAGEFFISDQFNFVIRKIDGAGIISRYAGKGIDGISGDGGLAKSASLNFPAALSADQAGNLYSSDAQPGGGENVRKISYCQSPLHLSFTGANTLCGGATTTLTANGATNYKWTSNAGNATTASISVKPWSSSYYSVVGTSGGCMALDTFRMTVTPVLSLTGRSDICLGGSISLHAGGATTYSWSANAGGGTSNSVTLVPAATTTYTLSGTSSNCTTVDTLTITVFPNTPPALVFKMCDSQSNCQPMSGDTICSYNVHDGLDCGGNYTRMYLCVSGANAISILPGNLALSSSCYFSGPTPASGTYTVTGSNYTGAGCPLETKTLVIYDCCHTGIPSLTEEPIELFVFPNPFEEELTLKLNHASGKTVHFTLYNVLGENIFSTLEKPFQEDFTTSIKLQDLSSGMYFLHLDTDNTHLTQKVFRK